MQTIVDDLLLGSPAAIAATKRLLREVPTLATDEATAWTAALSAEMFAGPDAQAGMQAYLDKRPPPWALGA